MWDPFQLGSFARTIVKAFVIGDMWVHDRAKKCPHSQIENSKIKPKLKILHLYENLMT
jgi:hypothetical protein